MSLPVFTHGDAGEQARALAALVAADLRAAIAARGRASFAAPGGSTPTAFLAALAAETVDWERVIVMPGDERWTAPTDARSNEGMIRAALPQPAFLSFWNADEAPEAAALRLSAALAGHLPLDVAVIGMGEDMHCASLFPGADALPAAMAAGAAPVAAIRAPGAPEPRLTLTLPALAGAGRLYLLIRGQAKRAALAEAEAEPNPLKAPVGAVLRAARSAEIHWAP
ncbi:MAG: 6-phosphogluconolactonase [Paracoccaceae bacterium]